MPTPEDIIDLDIMEEKKPSPEQSDAEEQEANFDNNFYDEDPRMVDVETKLLIVEEMRKRKDIKNPYMNALMSGNCDIIHGLLKQGLFCPLDDFQTLYVMACGYPVEPVAVQMLEMIRSGGAACMGDTDQDYAPCQKHREELRQAANKKGGLQI